jgi:hypothetical protein
MKHQPVKNKEMKFINAAFNVSVALLALMVINYILHVVVIPQWIIMVVLMIAALLFFGRVYLRMRDR